MVRSVLLGVAILLLTACEAAPRPSPTDVAAAPIVNGEIDDEHPAVVALTLDGFAFCSGTLVQPTLVITAAHCIHPESVGDRVDDIEVFFGTDVHSGEGTFVDVIQGVFKEDWYLDDPNLDDDIAILRLREPGPAEPLLLGPLPGLETKVTIVGFGITSEDGNDSGTKRVGMARIIESYQKVFILEDDEAATCSGDSGGTTIQRVSGVEYLIGVHTRSDCLEGMVEERIDAHLEGFLAPFLEEPTCEPDGQCALDCGAPDLDCPCLDDGHCTADCTDPARDADCDPACAPNNGCATDCPIPDPDCPLCVGDGVCEQGCVVVPDPDCEVATVGAVTSSAAGSGTGGGDGDGAEEDDGGGCAMARSNAAARPAPGPVAIALGALGLLARRRRRP
jgi:hypothetical protein